MKAHSKDRSGKQQPTDALFRLGQCAGCDSAAQRRPDDTQPLGYSQLPSAVMTSYAVLRQQSLNRCFRANKEHWEAVTPLHLGRGEFYDVEAFKRGASTLLPIERRLLGDVEGRSILHAQCHIGVDSMSLARLGARVTGVDFSEKAILAARSINEQCGLDCHFICCNIYDLPSHVDEHFDIAYASYGAICWLPDLALWCQMLADRLRSGGRLVVIDGHPFSYCVKTTKGNTRPFIARSYFSDGMPKCGPIDERGEYDYHATSVSLPTETYEWTYTMSDIVNAVASSGLVIQSLGEYRECEFRLYPEMIKGDDGLFRLPDQKSLYPLLFSIAAIKQ